MTNNLDNMSLGSPAGAHASVTELAPVARAPDLRWPLPPDAGEKGARPGWRARRKEPAGLRRRNRQLELENDILKRAAAYFARETVLPK
jgi:transposase